MTTILLNTPTTSLDEDCDEEFPLTVSHAHPTSRGHNTPRNTTPPDSNDTAIAQASPNQKLLNYTTGNLPTPTSVSYTGSRIGIDNSKFHTIFCPT